MRSEREMLDLILDVARGDERVRGVIMNGSRANPNAPRDIFQDFDIVYVVTEVESFIGDLDWIAQFGDIMILQTPEDMQDPPPENDGSYAYLMQFMDGNRIDLGLIPAAKLEEMEPDSLSILLLDKDGIIGPFPPSSDRDYLPKPPTAKAYGDCCNEFWWVCPYVAKGLWRREITYAKHMLDHYIRDQLMKILTWHIGVNTDFSVCPGKNGKYFQSYLDPAMWELLLGTYTDGDYEHTWDALFTMCDLFRITAAHVADHFGFEYPHGDDRRVTAHLVNVRSLPEDAQDFQGKKRAG
jgi:aminoglycoside 6-adenylyltransferase